MKNIKDKKELSRIEDEFIEKLTRILLIQAGYLDMPKKK